MSSIVDHLFAKAISFHQRGRLDEAAHSYRQILGMDAAHPDSLHLLGAIAFQRGAPDSAVDYYERAIKANSRIAAYHSNFALALAHLGRHAEAAGRYRSALALQPDYADALDNLANAERVTGSLQSALQHGRRALALRSYHSQSWYNVGITEQCNNHGQEAIRHFKIATILHPGFLDAVAGLSIALIEAGQLDDAELWCVRILGADSQSAKAEFTLGTLLERRRDFSAASEQYRRAVCKESSYAEAHYNFAAMQQLLGDLAAAEEAFSAAITARPSYAEAHNNLGIVRRERGNLKGAFLSFMRATVLKPDFTEACSSLAAALHAEGFPSEAIACFRQTIKLVPHHAIAYGNLGVALSAADNPEEAMACYRRAVILAPDHEGAFNNMGSVLHDLGELKVAERCLRRAIALRPSLASAYNNLGAVKRFKANDADLASLEALERSEAALPEEQKVYLHFALGKAYDDVGEKDRSFDQYLLGNALKRQSTIYHEAATLETFKRIETVFSRQLIAGRSRAEAPGSGPIFIVGMPRSGSTLVEQILASHPRVFGAGEAGKFERAAAFALGGTSFPEAVTSLQDEELARLGAVYQSSMLAKAGGSPRIADKTLENFRLCGLIHLAIPNARFIHTRRDPVDTCLSAFSKLFVGALPYTYNLGELGRYYRAYAGLMDYWQAVLPPGIMTEVRYENVVDDIEGQTRRILDACGLPWDDACLSFHETKRSVRTASATQVRQPIYKTSIGRWRPRPDLLQPLLDGLGPELLA